MEEKKWRKNIFVEKLKSCEGRICFSVVWLSCWFNWKHTRPLHCIKDLKNKKTWCSQKKEKLWNNIIVDWASITNRSVSKTATRDFSIYDEKRSLQIFFDIPKFLLLLQTVTFHGACIFFGILKYDESTFFSCRADNFFGFNCVKLYIKRSIISLFFFSNCLFFCKENWNSCKKLINTTEYWLKLWINSKLINQHCTDHHKTNQQFNTISDKLF